MSARFRKDDNVRVRRDPGDEWCPAQVALVSKNGKSLGLWLDGPVCAGDGMVLQALPLTVEDDGTIHGLTMNTDLPDEARPPRRRKEVEKNLQSTAFRAVGVTNLIPAALRARNEVMRTFGHSLAQTRRSQADAPHLAPARSTAACG